MKIKKLNLADQSFFIRLQQIANELPKNHKKRFPKLKEGVDSLTPDFFPKIIGRIEGESLMEPAGARLGFTQPNEDTHINCLYCGAGIDFDSELTIVGDCGDESLHSIECEECGEYTTVDNHLYVYETYGVIYD